MDTLALERRFEKIGAHLEVNPPSLRSRWRLTGPPFRVNVLNGKEGEHFTIETDGSTDISVVNLDTKDRHLLLNVSDKGVNSKFLCGHDERHWFVAAVPEKVRGVHDVKTAMEALKPVAVKNEEVRKGVKAEGRKRRKNDAFIRQGEWFFVPESGMNPNRNLILKNEPISRGNGGKPHMCEYIYRIGGTSVYVNSKFPTGITREQVNRLPREERRGSWREMTRDARVYAKGRVWHPDHSTVILDTWCRVYMNRENEAVSMMRSVAFLD